MASKCPKDKVVSLATGRCIQKNPKSAAYKAHLAAKQKLAIKNKQKTPTPPSSKKISTPSAKKTSYIKKKGKYDVETIYNRGTGEIKQYWRIDGKVHERSNHLPSILVYDTVRKKYTLQKWYKGNKMVAYDRISVDGSYKYEIKESGRSIYSKTFDFPTNVTFHTYHSGNMVFMVMIAIDLFGNRKYTYYISTDGITYSQTDSEKLKEKSLPIRHEVGTKYSFMAETKPLRIPSRIQNKNIQVKKIHIRKVDSSKAGIRVAGEKRWHTKAGVKKQSIRYEVFTKFLALHYNICPLFNEDGKQMQIAYSSGQLVYRLYESYVTYPIKNIQKNIEKCKRRFIGIPLTLTFVKNGKPSAHANLLLIDSINKTIEHFEPQGTIENFDPHGTIEYKKQLETKLHILARFLGYKLLSQHHICPVYSFQTYFNNQLSEIGIDDPGGYCEAWVLYYMYERVRNPHIPPLKLTTQLIAKIKTKVGAGRFRNFIRQFATYIVNLSKKKKYTSLKYEELYHKKI